MSRFVGLALPCLLVLACGGAPTEAPPDGGLISPADAALDAGGDAALDAAPDGGGPADATPPDATPVHITVWTDGDGRGGVTAASIGLDCGASCAATVPAGTHVTLVALPAPDSEVVAWSVPCTGTTCDVVVDADVDVRVTFALIRVPVVVNVVGPGSGTVVDDQGELSCSEGTCTARYLPGTPVVLSATGSPFHGWTGDCSGTAGCALVADAARAVRAVFGHLAILDGGVIFASHEALYDLMDELIVTGDDLDVIGSHEAPGKLGTHALPATDGTFVARLDAHTGDVRWVRDFNASGMVASGGLARRGDRLYAAMWFEGTIVVDGETVTGSETSTLLVAFDADGSILWHRVLRGLANVGYASPSSLAVSADGRLYVGGSFSGTVDFGAGTATAPIGSASDGWPWLLALSTDDGEPLWLKTFSTGQRSSVSALAVLASGDVVASGHYEGSINLGGGTFVPATSRASFAARFAGSSGAHVWSRSVDNGFSADLQVDAQDRLFWGGSTSGSVDLGNGNVVGNPFSIAEAVARLDPSTGATLWGVTTGRPALADAADGRVLLVGNSEPSGLAIVLLDAITGDELQRRDVPGGVTGGIRSSYAGAGVLAGPQAWIVGDFRSAASIDGISAPVLPSGDEEHRLLHVGL